MDINLIIGAISAMVGCAIGTFIADLLLDKQKKDKID